MRVVFAGTPGFAVPSLEALLATEYSPVAVYTQPDRPAGRGHRLQASPVKRFALAHGIPVLQPGTLCGSEEIDRFARHRPDLLVIAAYGLILPGDLLKIPALGAINIHASLLPRWRGAAPIQRAILAGDGETGITIMQVVEKLDAGPMLLRKAVPIRSRETAGEVHERLARLGAQALLEVLPALAAGNVSPEPQEEAQATYAAKITRKDARLDWNLPALDLERAVRAFNPWPVAFTRIQGRNLRIWDAMVVDRSADAAPGTVVRARKCLEVACGEGCLRLLEVQLPGGRRLPAEAFLNAHPCQGVRLQ